MGIDVHVAAPIRATHKIFSHKHNVIERTEEGEMNTLHTYTHKHTQYKWFQNYRTKYSVDGLH